MIRVALAATATPLVRAGLEGMLRGEADIELVTGDEDAPDAIVAMLDSDDELPAEAGSIPMVILADHPRPAWVVDALRAGVRSILPADCTREELTAAVRAAAAGLIVLHPQDSHPLLAAAPVGVQSLPETLTARETEVLRMLADGLSNKEIAARLEISEHTVKFHVASLMGKLNASSRTEAVTIGLRHGLILL